MNKLYLFLALLFVCLLTVISVNSEAQQFKYTGAEGCACHKAEISDWERSKHGQAFDLLKPGKRASKKKKAGLDPDKDYTRDPKCLPCHVTGYKEDGGFKDLESTGNLAGIGCEMCHGPGSEYRVLHKEKGMTFTKADARGMGQVYGSFDESVCRRCHENKFSPFKPEIDERYRFKLKEALMNDMSFHKLYPLSGVH